MHLDNDAQVTVTRVTDAPAHCEYPVFHQSETYVTHPDDGYVNASLSLPIGPMSADRRWVGSSTFGSGTTDYGSLGFGNKEHTWEWNLRKVHA